MAVPDMIKLYEDVRFTVIRLYKQQHPELVRHPLSIKYVPVQFGVEDITPIQLDPPVIVVVDIVDVLGQVV